MIRIVAKARTAVVLAAWLIGGPALLINVAGSPLPHQKPSTAQIQLWLQNPLDPAYKNEAACVFAWAVWTTISLALVALLAVRLRPARLRRIVAHLPAPTQGVAAALLGTAVVTTAATAMTPPTLAAASSPAHLQHDLVAQEPGSLGTSQTQAGPRTVDPKTDLSAPPGNLRRAEQAAPVSDPGTTTRADQRTATSRRDVEQGAPTGDGARTRDHLVVKGDTLWTIAQQDLGNPLRWHAIYSLNRGHIQSDGHRLSDPDKIHVGWDLAMPITAESHPVGSPPPATSSTPANTPTPAASASGSPAAAPDSGTPAPGTPTGHTPTAATSQAPSAATPTPGNHAAPASPATSNPAASPPATTEPSNTPSARNTTTGGITLPSQGWISLGLAASIAVTAALLRLHHRRHQRLGTPIGVATGPAPTPLPAPLRLAEAASRHDLPPASDSSGEQSRPSARSATSPVAAPIGLDPGGAEVSLFDLPGPGLALTGSGAQAAARAVLAAALATGVSESLEARPVVVTTADVLARLLPAGAPPVGLDPDRTSFDGERLIVLDEVAAVTYAEEEMIVRRRLLDTFDLDSITALNARTDHAEAQPPYVLLIEATTRHAARLLAVGAHRAALHLHPVILGQLDGLPAAAITADGTVTGGDAAGLARLSTLAAEDLAAVLSMLTDASARPEPGHDIDLDPAEVPAPPDTTEPLPAQLSGRAAPVQLRVLGPVLAETGAGPVATGMRSGSYLVLASLAVHPGGRSLDQLSADLHPDTDPTTAGKRIRTDISTTRRVLRTASGLNEPMFVVYDPATGRYRLDAELITVDLWQMLTAIEAANTADDDTAALAALREATRLYAGDFADGHDQTWITDHATTHRHQILAVYARIAELLEADQPDQAVAALERALDLDPVNEELYQRIMRIHGRAGHPDQVRRTLRRLEERLADLGDAEPSEATRRVAERQLRPATTSGARS